MKENFILDNGGALATRFDGYLRDEGEAIALADGSKVVVAGAWTGCDLANLLAKASSYDIVCADTPVASSPSLVGNGYSLEYLDGFVPQDAVQVVRPFAPEGAAVRGHRRGVWFVVVAALIVAAVLLLLHLL